ncbi:hypothetical protein ElyMa_000790000 [Elysia marginata]|uniref:25S rRNA (uridine-N(3))-methyltransferase BMT5-like domain-containing protein n=1 Tax=Elysia marginata TaxID=1093978 RepID=A0AAV4GTQ7_9GAST|nr:hypothetical protein ElyMa_000790000 [Elysia marginata]
MSCDTVLVGEDTDLLVLLLYHASNKHHKLFFAASRDKTWDIHKTKAILGKDLCDNIIFLHALTGCDTTSHPFSIWKGSILTKFKNSVQLRATAKTFMVANEDEREKIIKLGGEALVCLYGGSIESLNELRYRKYMTKVASQKHAVQAHTLPPTCAASKFHVLRVFLQVKIWKELIDPAEEDPIQWGWEHLNDVLYPIYTDTSPAPKELLNFIFCKCK